MSMDVEMEQPLQQSLSIEETSLMRDGPSSENSALDLLKSESDRIKTFYQTALSAIMVFIMAALSSYNLYSYSTTSHNKVHLSNLLVAEGLFVFITFLCAVVLMMLDIFLYQNGQRGRRCYRVVSILVMVTGMMLVMADTVLVIITNRNNILLSVILMPVLVLVIVGACAAAWMGEQRSSEIASRFDAAMKNTFDVATVGTIASFGVQGAVIFGYLKTPGGNQAKPDPSLDLAVCYVTSTLSVMVMMVCAMPLALLPNGMLKALVTIVERLRHAVLVALAFMALIVAVEFLDGLITLSFFPEAVAAVLCAALQIFSACQPQGESSTLDFAFRIVVTAGFMLMTGLYAAFLGTDRYSLYLKAAMSLLLAAILSSLSRLATPFHMPENGGAVERSIVRAALAMPAVALVAAVPLVLIIMYNHYLNR